MKQFTVAILGLGARGYHTYAQYQKRNPGRMKITAIADVDRDKVQTVAREFGVPEDRCYYSAEELLRQDKLADVAFITTQDVMHKAQAVAAMRKGYDILLEKPVATTAKDCIEIRDLALLTGRKVTVCHVLRYTTFFRTIKEIIDSGKIGKVMSVQALENVGYWHQAHSFVRGNWRNTLEECPMILAKCCHDFDILNWLIGKKCISVNSFGSLGYFKEECAPNGSAQRCCDCDEKIRRECPYDAYKIYMDNREERGVMNGYEDWPVNILAENPTVESIEKALRTGPYGRCVFHCDNDAVDHQVVNMNYEDGVTVAFTMCAFTENVAREMKVMGTLGEIVADQVSNTVKVSYFNGGEKLYDINALADDLSGHGGGDNKMLEEMFESLEDGNAVVSSIENSVNSHLIAFAAEKSRNNGGQNVNVE